MKETISTKCRLVRIKGLVRSKAFMDEPNWLMLCPHVEFNGEYSDDIAYEYVEEIKIKCRICNKDFCLGVMVN